DITLVNGTNTVTSPGYTFSAGDIGKSYVIKGAANVTGNVSPAFGTITAVSGHQITLSNTYNSGGGYGTPRLDFGTDNVNAFNAARAAVPSSGGTLYIPAGSYFLGSTTSSHYWLINRGNINVSGDGIGRSNLF